MAYTQVGLGACSAAAGCGAVQLAQAGEQRIRSLGVRFEACSRQDRASGTACQCHALNPSLPPPPCPPPTWLAAVTRHPLQSATSNSRSIKGHPSQRGGRSTAAAFAGAGCVHWLLICHHKSEDRVQGHSLNPLQRLCHRWGARGSDPRVASAVCRQEVVTGTVVGAGAGAGRKVKGMKGGGHSGLGEGCSTKLAIRLKGQHQMSCSIANLNSMAGTYKMSQLPDAHLAWQLVSLPPPEP